jgi:hypothetical protein
MVGDDINSYRADPISLGSAQESLSSSMVVFGMVITVERR